MNLSHRALQVEPFYAMEFAKRATVLEEQGHDIVRLNIGEPDFGAPVPVTAELARLAAGTRFPYTAALGIAELRRAIAAFYHARHGVDVEPERVIVTAGASAALLLSCAAIIDPGDEVLVADPSYPCNRQFVEVFGGRATLVTTTAATRFQLDRASLERSWSAGTKAVMVASPSNPTGTSVPTSELAAICHLARERGAWRIVDEIYLELSDHTDDGERAPTVLALDPDAVVVNSFSKYFGMTGWRLGWCVVPEALVPAVEGLAQNLYICPSGLAQHAALACFRPESLAICEERREMLTARRSVALDGLESLGLAVPVPPDGAFYVYFDVQATGMDSWEFCQRALDEAHVALTPGRDFGQATADTHVRLSYATAVATIDEGIGRLRAWLG